MSLPDYDLEWNTYGGNEWASSWWIQPPSIYSLIPQAHYAGTCNPSYTYNDDNAIDDVGMCQQDCATPYWEKCASGLYVSGSEFSDAFSVILSLDPEATNIRACESGFQVKLLASVSYTCSGSGSGGSCDELVPQSYTTVSDPAQCAFDKSFFKVRG